MKLSKKGTWVLESDNFKYLAWVEQAEIIEIHAYQKGFSSISAKVQKFGAKPGKYIEITWPDYYFKEISYSTREDTMLYLIRKYENIPTTPKIAKKIIEYRQKLYELYPEKLI